MKVLLLAMLALPGMASPVIWHELNLFYTDGRFVQTGPYPDYDFFNAVYPFLLSDTDLRTFGYLNCSTAIACTPAPAPIPADPSPVAPPIDPPPPLTAPSVPEPATGALLALAILLTLKLHPNRMKLPRSATVITGDTCVTTIANSQNPIDPGLVDTVNTLYL